MEGFSFHLWDGLIKFAVFLAYILVISRLREIRRVFQYHGAEHKAIAAYESGARPLNVDAARRHSRLHPRCGTAFLLFVLSIAILLHVLLLPMLLFVWSPENALHKHGVILLLKLLLMLPISALAYEAIRLGARLEGSIVGAAMRAPGLLLQLLTTRNPDRAQLEVALTALNEALKRGGGREEAEIIIPPYILAESP